MTKLLREKKIRYQILQMVDFIEKTCWWVRRDGRSRSAHCFSSWMQITKNIPSWILWICMVKYLALLDSMLHRTERFVSWKNIKYYNLHVDFTSAWLCPNHTGRAASSRTIWSMFWASSNLLPRSVLCWQHAVNTLGGTALHHVPVVPTESMLHATPPTSRANLFDTTNAKSVQ